MILVYPNLYNFIHLKSIYRLILALNLNRVLLSAGFNHKRIHFIDCFLFFPFDNRYGFFTNKMQNLVSGVYITYQE